MSKKLSIIVPVYNMATEGKLNYCLDSLVGQTIRGLYDYEILCVDDASTDDSLEILLDYQKRYPELVCVIPNPVNLRRRCQKCRTAGGAGGMDRFHRQ